MWSHRTVLVYCENPRLRRKFNGLARKMNKAIREVKLSQTNETPSNSMLRAPSAATARLVALFMRSLRFRFVHDLSIHDRQLHAGSFDF